MLRQDTLACPCLMNTVDTAGTLNSLKFINMRNEVISRYRKRSPDRNLWFLCLAGVGDIILNLMYFELLFFNVINFDYSE